MLIKEGKTNVRYIFIVVVLAAIVGAGILVFSMQKEVPSQFPQITKPIEKPEKTLEELFPEELSTDKFANWHTYRLEEPGFEIRYPPTWTAEPYISEHIKYGVELVDQESLAKAVALRQEFDGTSNVSYDSYDRILISVKDVDAYGVYDYDVDVYDGDLSSYLYITWQQNVIQEALFRGYPAFEVIVGGAGSNYALFVEKDGLVYKINLLFAWDKDRINAIEKGILSTFRFIE